MLKLRVGKPSGNGNDCTDLFVEDNSGNFQLIVWIINDGMVYSGMRKAYKEDIRHA